MDVSAKQIRFLKYKDMVSRCDSRETSEKVLIEKILDLEDSLHELQNTYVEFLNRKIPCVQVPF